MPKFLFDSYILVTSLKQEGAKYILVSFDRLLVLYLDICG